ncbi:MAG: Na+/H+ antiporter NhaC family protein [Prevotella sp.]|nr:Na+/H+ antiporter NhaC family protein [Prevotella sp.]
MKNGLFSLSPLLVFVTLYLLTSIVCGDFYKVPITVAFLAASVYAVAIGKGPLRHRIDVFSRGAGTPQMMLMIWIFVLAGAFAHSAKMMGSIDATVNLALSLLPGQMMLAGLFLAACFISLSIGTSVGTIVALTPIAAGVAAQTGASVAVLVAAVVGGSFFGDNLSFISDTTIIATQTQGCKRSDKFRVNSFIVVPAAVVVLVLYLFMGQGISSPSQLPAVEPVKVLPYLVVLVTAIFGLNVMAVLTLGIVLTGAIGLLTGGFADVFAWMQSMGDGIVGMGELIVITMLAGGLLETIKAGGGIDCIIGLLTRHISGKRGAELSIAALVSIVNLCTANNTVSIITVGGIAHQIGEKYGLDPRKCASLLDTFSCTVQGLIPYGAQVLMAAGLAAINPIEILPALCYPVAIGIAALLAILLRYPRRYSAPPRGP